MEVTLALGGGGVKGYAHIGVLRYLENCGIRVRAIAGTSAGGLFGSTYAAGVSLQELDNLLSKVNQAKLYTRQPGDGPSLLGLGGVSEVLEGILGDITFEDLQIPMAMTAVDLESGEPVVMNTGRVLDAVLATIALPGIFPPRQWKGRLLIDGGVLDPVPIPLARALAPDLPVVAVVLTPRLQTWNGNHKPPRFLRSIPLINRIFQTRLPQSLNIFLRSVDIVGCVLTDLRLELDQPDVIIRPPLSNIGLVDTVDIMDLIAMGERATEKAMPQILQLNHWSFWLSHRVPWLGEFIKKS
jgi:NTE family protein